MSVSVETEDPPLVAISFSRAPPPKDYRAAQNSSMDWEPPVNTRVYGVHFTLLLQHTDSLMLRLS